MGTKERLGNREERSENRKGAESEMGMKETGR